MTPHGNKSFWIRDCGDYMPNPSLTGDTESDVLVVGGGTAGLSAAWHLRKDDPSLKVILIEAEIVGWGASGRNAGWLLPDFGPDQIILRKKYGQQRARDIVEYGKRAFEYTGEIIQKHGLRSEYRRNGGMKVAFDERWIDSLKQLAEFYESMGLELEWLEGSQLQSEYAGNENFKAAIFDPDIALIHPCKHVRELKRLAMEAGVTIYEESPAIDLGYAGSDISVAVPQGSIRAEKLVITTNAYTNMLQGSIGRRLRKDQSPTIARASVTEPLTAQQWESIGWERKCGLQSSLLLMHVMTPLSDGRILFNYAFHSGHYPGGGIEPTYSMEAALDSLEHLRRIFPTLRNIRMEQTWGGHVSTTFDRIPHLGWLVDQRVLYLTGCWAHGQAPNHLHGQTISDLIRDVKSDLTDLWFIHTKKQNWPIAPFDEIAKSLVWGNYRRRNRCQIRGSIFD